MARTKKDNVEIINDYSGGDSDGSKSKSRYFFRFRISFY